MIWRFWQKRSTPVPSAHPSPARNSSKRWLSPTAIGYGLIAYWGMLGAITTAQQFTYVQQWERQTQVWFTRQRGPVQPPDEVVILAIDDESLSQGEFYTNFPDKYPFLAPMESWPWQRTVYAQVIDRLMNSGARGIAIDLIFAIPSTYGPEDDRQFQQALQRHAGRITLAATYSPAETPQGLTLRLEQPNPSLASNPSSIGYINILKSADGRVHELASQYYKQSIEGSGLPQLPSFQDALLQAAQVQHPPAKGNTIFFYGPRGTFTTIPFWHVIDPENWKNLYQNGAYFKNKIVLIGPTFLDSQDFQRTPFDEELPGVEIHANAIASLMQGRTIVTAIPNPVGQGLVVLLVIAVATAILRVLPKHIITPLLWGFGGAVLWLGVGYLNFAFGNTILPSAIPALILALGGTSHFIAGAIGNQLEKRYLYRTLERYVSVAIAKEIISQPEEYQAQLLGRKIKAAILFCDIRGFTTLSSQLPPEELVTLLNTYLSAMVDAIIQERGTIDKYIGDAIMAEFGAPVSQGEKADAMCAIRAALGMRKTLANLRERWKEEGQFLLFNGIGINYGEVVAGNIGSAKRTEYTVIGDTVNVASRVEGLTKGLGTDLLITDSLYELVQDEVEVEWMGEQAIRGRGKPVQLYSVIALKGESTHLYYQVKTELKQAQEDLKHRLEQLAQQ